MKSKSKVKTKAKTKAKTKKQSLLQGVKRLGVRLLLVFVVGSVLMVGVLRFVPVPITAFMLNRHYQDLQQDKGYLRIRYRWVAYDSVSGYAPAAVIAAEDQLFYQHAGFDIDSIFSAVETWLDGGKLRGASTISQQVAKNLFLTPSRSFWRKGLEAWFTFLIENIWDKRRILEVYLNVAEFGDHLFGIEAASRKYYGIPAKKLTPRQAALLAATLPNPRKFRADKPTDYLRARQLWILGQMRNLGYL